jgi:hypothetical protein
MIKRSDFHYAPDDGGSGGAGVDVVTGTLPSEVEPGDIDPWADVELGDEGANNAPPELAGKSVNELLAEIEKRDVAARELSTKVDPATNLANQFAQFLELQKPKVGPVAEGFRVKQPVQQANPEEFAKWSKTMAEKFLDDPTGATREVIGREVSPLLVTMAESLAMMSRENARLDPETKDVYAKYSAEIEADVAEIDAMTKLKNPRIYHAAVERARSRHFSELLTEQTTAQQEVIATAYLKSIGVDIATLKKGAPVASTPAASTLAAAGRSSAPTPTTKRTINLNPQQRAAVNARALALGVTAEAAAARMRERGEI